jgi:hypothetical protein
MEGTILNKKVFLVSDHSRETVITCIRFVCMFLFLYTAYAKLIDHDRFFKGLSRVHMIYGYAFYISWLVPSVEVLTFILLLFPRTAKLGLYAFISSMILFTCYIISALIWEKTLPCHCGGIIEKLSWTQHLWFNLAFILLALYGIRLINLQNLKNYKK